MKNQNDNRGWKIADGKNILATLLLLFSILQPRSSSGQTPVFDWGYIAPGVPQTNPVIIQPWPAGNAWVAFNVTNSVYVIATTNTPGANGYWSNSLYPTTYREFIPAYNVIRYFTVPNTTTPLSLAQCSTSIAASSAALSTYQLITNWLGYAPPPPTLAGITNALGFTPMTNTYVALTNVLGFIPATNVFGANTNIVFVGNNTTNTLYVTNGVVQRMSTP